MPLSDAVLAELIMDKVGTRESIANDPEGNLTARAAGAKGDHHIPPC